MMLQFSRFWICVVWQLVRKQRFFILQTTRTDCGVASALTLLGLIGRQVGASEAVDKLDKTRTGTDLESLRAFVSECLGEQCRALSVEAEMLQNIKLPAILHLRQLHFVVLLQVSRDLVFVHDPAIGPVIYSRDDFDELSSKHLVEFPGAKRTRPRGAKPKKQAWLRSQQTALFVLELAKRLLGIGLLLAVSTFLFLVLNQVGDFSLLKSGLGLGVLGLFFMALRLQSARVQMEASATQQKSYFLRILKTLSRGRDFVGFRGRPESDVAKSVRKAVQMDLPRYAQLPTTIASIIVAPLILVFLGWEMVLIWCGLICFAFVFAQLGGLYKCRVSVRGTSGRYTRLFASHPVFGTVSASEICGELAKWAVILIAGLGVLWGEVQAPSLVFWVLFAMQSAATDFRLVAQFSTMFGAPRVVPDLIGTIVESRNPRDGEVMQPQVTHADGITVVDGISPLTRVLQQPDLTVLEQRRVMAKVVKEIAPALGDMDAATVNNVMIFGPGHEATSVDFEFCNDLAANRNDLDHRTKESLPAIVGEDVQRHVERALLMCGTSDFPIFWDVHSRIAISELADQVSTTQLQAVGHLTLKKFTFVKRVDA